jgi:putative membrane protein insertion efficiency factor
MLKWLLLVPRRLLAALIRAYQLTLSPLLPASCRFHPSCSQYTLEAVRKYGAARGGWLGIRRLVRCHPWNPGGFDPVP